MAQPLVGPAAAPTPRTGLVLVAAGRGTRLDAGRPKALVDVAGRTMLEHALLAFRGFPGKLTVAVAAPADHLELVGDIASAALGEAGVDDVTFAVVAGGASRQSSVAAALDALPADCDVVLVHDAARALAPRALAERVAGAVRATGDGVVPVLPVVDTIKRLDGDAVVETPDRAMLGAAQTPQGFPAAALREAYRAASVEYTDDAALAAAAGLRVRTVPGDALAFKITRPDDLDRAVRELSRSGNDSGAGALGRARLGQAESGSAGETRVGLGIDAHAFDDDAPLHLACLHWPGERGLAGHSDGDVVAHAICDALLAAASLGDLGGVFGTDDPELAGAGGEVFLRRARELLEANGSRIRNVSVQFVAQRPRFAPRRDEAKAALEAVLGAPVSIAATTTDRLGFTGRGGGRGAQPAAPAAAPPPQHAPPRGRAGGPAPSPPPPRPP
ncbi:MAG: 2-C-methyl-D-erythritol 4-phosphate cytidylyltransferase, partial [Pseudoclavibacter sp.]